MKGAVLPDLVVRSVCVFLPEQECQNEPMFNAAVARAASHASQIRAALEAADVSVQTTRLAVPSPAVFGTTEAALVAAHILDAAPVDSASLGTVHPHQTSFLNLDFILNVLKSTASVFISATIATASALHPAAARVAADVITQAAPHQSGMLNFRFAALANVAPFSPFFPAGYAGPSPTFLTTIGLQAAPLARTTLTARNNAASHRLTNIAEVASHQIVSICAPICEVNVDFSLAPYPTEAASTGRSIAHAGGVRSFGMPGCVAGASLAATAIARAKFSRVGLCGVMLPVSEDVDLAANTTSISELLLCSAVCGTGLDVC